MHVSQQKRYQSNFHQVLFIKGGPISNSTQPEPYYLYQRPSFCLAPCCPSKIHITYIVQRIMSDAPPADLPPHGGPGWINPTIQTKMAWRDDDVVVSVPGKSGTTWTMNIVHQLREKGDRNFEDIYAEVIWCEAMSTPDCTVDDMVKKMDGISSSRPRAFKTHASPPLLPFHDKVKYVVVARNPEEVIVSMCTFFSKHSEEFLRSWGAPPEMFRFPNLEVFYNGFVKNAGFDKSVFKFVSEWWKLKEKDNVLMLHYNEMVADHEGSIKKISDFLGYGPYTDEEWQTILELTSWKWMKANERRFEATTVWSVPPLVRGGMMRQGSSGLARQEGMSEAMAQEIRDRGREELTDEDAFEWLYNGGKL